MERKYVAGCACRRVSEKSESCRNADQLLLFPYQWQMATEDRIVQSRERIAWPSTTGDAAMRLGFPRKDRPCARAQAGAERAVKIFTPIDVPTSVIAFASFFRVFPCFHGCAATVLHIENQRV